jgi:hypothetical protein
MKQLCLFVGTLVFASAEDDTFTQPGKVGLWTKADAASSFDDLEARAK